jgi:hypothetical protein
MILSFFLFLVLPHLPFSASRISTKLSFIIMHRIPTLDEVVMNLKCYKSVILPLVIRNNPLITLANIARASRTGTQRITRLFSILAGCWSMGSRWSVRWGFTVYYAAGGRLHRENDTFLILSFDDSHSLGW